MRSLLLLMTILVVQQFALAQPLAFSEIGSHPAYCRLFPYQSGNGVVYAAASGGTPDYSYEWTNLQTGATSSNATWGGLNPGSYEITITDDVGATITQTVQLDSINPEANFDEISGSLMPVTDGWVGFFYEEAYFSNVSEGYANPYDPNADTVFFWNMHAPSDPWQISHDASEVFGGNYLAGTHSVCLVAFNKNGCSDTLCKQIHIFGPVGIEDETAETKFISIYSDQLQSMLHMNCGGFEEQLIVEVFSANGQQVALFEASPGNNDVPFNAVAGVYLYQVKSQTSQEVLATGKLIH